MSQDFVTCRDFTNSPSSLSADYDTAQPNARTRRLTPRAFDISSISSFRVSRSVIVFLTEDACFCRRCQCRSIFCFGALCISHQVGQARRERERVGDFRACFDLWQTPNGGPRKTLALTRIRTCPIGSCVESPIWNDSLSRIAYWCSLGCRWTWMFITNSR